MLYFHFVIVILGQVLMFGVFFAVKYVMHVMSLHCVFGLFHKKKPTENAHEEYQ